MNCGVSAKKWESNISRHSLPAMAIFFITSRKIRTASTLFLDRGQNTVIKIHITLRLYSCSRANAQNIGIGFENQIGLLTARIAVHFLHLID
jgi:hypothetical protein